MNIETGRVRVVHKVERGIVQRAFETLVGDVLALRCDLVAGIIGPRDFIAGLRLLLPRLERFAPGGPASAAAERCEEVVLNALTQGESSDERADGAAAGAEPGPLRGPAGRVGGGQ